MDTPPKEKAIELVKKLKEYSFHNFDNDAEEQQINNAKESALICCFEIINALKNFDDPKKHYTEVDYWGFVIKEIRLITTL